MSSKASKRFKISFSSCSCRKFSYGYLRMFPNQRKSPPRLTPETWTELSPPSHWWLFMFVKGNFNNKSCCLGGLRCVLREWPISLPPRFALHGGCVYEGLCWNVSLYSKNLYADSTKDLWYVTLKQFYLQRLQALSYKWNHFISFVTIWNTWELA